MSKKDRFEDDGRTIADMSGIERQPLLLPNLKGFKKRREEQKTDSQENDPSDNNFRKYYGIPENKETRKAYLGGAIGATLLIALIYLGAFALLVVILLLIWGVL